MSLSDDAVGAATGLANWTATTAAQWVMARPDMATKFILDPRSSERALAQKSLLSFIVGKASTEPEFLRSVYVVVEKVAREKAGIQLDPFDPFSIASLTAAISAKVGIPLTNITDKEAVKSDVLRYGASQALAKTGLTLDPADPFSKASITTAIAAASGVPLTDITDKAQIRADLMAYGKAQMAEEIGARVNGKMAKLVALPAVEQMESMISTANAERTLVGMPELKKDQIAQRMLVIDGVVRAAAREEIATYETKVCLWSKDLARKGAQVMASRRYRERMKQSGWSKSWTRNGVIADGG